MAADARAERRRQARAKPKPKAAKPPSPPLVEGGSAPPPQVAVLLVEIAEGEFIVQDVVTTAPIRVREAQHFLEEGIKHVRKVFDKP